MREIKWVHLCGVREKTAGWLRCSNIRLIHFDCVNIENIIYVRQFSPPTSTLIINKLQCKFLFFSMFSPPIQLHQSGLHLFYGLLNNFHQNFFCALRRSLSLILTWWKKYKL